MLRIGISLAAAIILLTNGVFEGIWTNRWHRSGELDAGITRLMSVPTTIGDWHAVKSEEIEEKELTQAGIEGYFYRHYENRLNGKQITVLLMCGRPGPLALHTPDICYRGAGFIQNGAIAKWPLDYGSGSTPADFRRAKFSKDDTTQVSCVRIAWIWGADGKWVVPSTPRVTFARLPVLYKLYIVQQETPTSERSDEEVCKGFLEQMLPALDAALKGTK